MWWKRCAPSAPSSTGRTRCLCASVASSDRDPRRDLRGRERRHGVLGEDVPDDRCGLDHRPLARRERVEPRREERLDRGRYVDLGQLVGEPPRAVRRSTTAPSSTSIRRSCSAKSGFPSDAVDDAVEHGGVERPAAEQALDHALRIARRRAARGRRGVERAPVLQSGISSRSSGRVGQRTSTGASHRLDEVLDQREQRRLGPVDVLDDEDHRPVGGEVREEAPDGPEQLLDRERLDGQAERRREPRRHAVARRVGERGELRLPPPSRRRR